MTERMAEQVVCEHPPAYRTLPCGTVTFIRRTECPYCEIERLRAELEQLEGPCKNCGQWVVLKPEKVPANG